MKYVLRNPRIMNIIYFNLSLTAKILFFLMFKFIFYLIKKLVYFIIFLISFLLRFSFKIIFTLILNNLFHILIVLFAYKIANDLIKYFNIR
jgi:hypothetical protein